MTRGSGPISWLGGTEPRKRHRMGSKGVTAQQEAAGRASRARRPCGAGPEEAGESWSAGGSGGGEQHGGLGRKRSWVGESCSQRPGASRSQGARPGDVAEGGLPLTSGGAVERTGSTR